MQVTFTPTLHCSRSWCRCHGLPAWTSLRLLSAWCFVLFWTVGTQGHCAPRSAIVPADDKKKRSVCPFGLSADLVGIAQPLQQLDEWDELWVVPVYRHTFSVSMNKEPHCESRAPCSILSACQAVAYHCYQRSDHVLIYWSIHCCIIINSGQAQ